jgi:predicted secreted protein
MAITSGVVLFVLLWWLVLFVVLPIGTRPRDTRTEEGGWRGVPERPLLWRKILGTTALTAVLWGLAYLLIESGWFSFHDGGWPVPITPPRN